MTKEIFMSNQETKKALTAVDRSTKTLAATVESVQKVVVDLASVASLAASLATDIEFKQSELEALEGQFTVKQRELTAELNLKVKEDADKVLEGLLKDRGLMTVVPTEYYSIQSQVRTLQEGNADDVAAAVKEAEKATTIKHQAELAALKSAQQVEVASIKASEASLRDRIAFYETQVSQLQEEIRAERNSRIEIAKAEAQKQGVTVNTGK